MQPDPASLSHPSKRPVLMPCRSMRRPCMTPWPGHPCPRQLSTAICRLRQHQGGGNPWGQLPQSQGQSQPLGPSRADPPPAAQQGTDTEHILSLGLHVAPGSDSCFPPRPTAPGCSALAGHGAPGQAQCVLGSRSWGARRLHANAVQRVAGHCGSYDLAWERHAQLHFHGPEPRIRILPGGQCHGWTISGSGTQHQWLDT